MAKKLKAAGMKGTSYALDKHRKIVRELPERMEKKMQNIAARNEILHAAEAYSARLERDRVTAHLHNGATSAVRGGSASHWRAEHPDPQARGERCTCK